MFALAHYFRGQAAPRHKEENSVWQTILAWCNLYAKVPTMYIKEEEGRRNKSFPWKQQGTDQTLEEDLQDVRRSRNGDGEAYRRLIERHQGWVSGMMWRFSRDPDTHEDLVQDVFVEAYQSLSSYRSKAPFPHWLARIATRVGYHHWKRQKRERAIQTIPLEEWHEVPEEPADGMDPAEAAEFLHRLLEQLPPRDRLALTLRYIEDHSVQKTAELTGWKPSMVKVQTWRARNKLRRLFEKAREEEAR